jgi:hypothetical protein
MAKGGETGAENPSAPGWYPDPWTATGKGERYFDGKQWGSTERPLARHTTVARKDKTESQGSGRFRRGRVIVAIVVIGVAAWAITEFQKNESTTTASSGGAAPAGATDHPSPSREEASHPLGSPSAVPSGSGQFEVIAHQRKQPSTPIAFDPCRPIHYVINSDGAPNDGLALVQDGVARVQTATGLHFIYDGTTTERPDKDRVPYQPKRYDTERWAPVLIAWSNEQSFPGLAGYVAGLGSSQPIASQNGEWMYATGQVVLDREQLSETGAPDRGAARAIILHELGHLVGLDHTSDRGQIMFSESQFNVRDYADGDLRGLALLGRQACFPGL